jgi:hypothetical protein
MKTVGRAFGFYIEYWQQMQALYEDDDKDSKQALESTLPEDVREDTLRRVKLVGDRACKQAAALLKKCGGLIEGHFKKFGNAHTKITSRPSSIGAYWGIKLRLWPKRPGWRSKKTHWETGVWFECLHQKPVLVLYLWMRGGREAEQRLAKVFGKNRVKYRSCDFDWYAGSIFIGNEIPFNVSHDDKFEIGEEIILNEVRSRLKKIAKRDVQKVFAL